MLPGIVTLWTYFLLVFKIVPVQKRIVGFILAFSHIVLFNLVTLGDVVGKCVRVYVFILSLSYKFDLYL